MLILRVLGVDLLFQRFLCDSHRRFADYHDSFSLSTTLFVSVLLFPAVFRENLRYLILAVSILGAAGMYSCSSRYQAINDPAFSRTIIVDRWTGNVTVRH